MLNFTKKEGIGILIVAVFVILFGVIKIRDKDIKPVTDSGEIIENIDPSKELQIQAEKINNKIEEKEIYVQISGEVNNPGAYKVFENLRICEVVEMAGGFTEYADDKRIDLTKKVFEGQRIYILGIGESEQNKTDFELKNEIQNIDKNVVILVNINSADEEELCSLSGIGPSKAKAIIEYRNKTPFEKKEELINVSGIGEKTYEKIEKNICVRWNYDKRTN